LAECAKIGLEIQDTIDSLFADDQLLIAQDSKDLEHMTKKLMSINCGV